MHLDGCEPIRLSRRTILGAGLAAAAVGLTPTLVRTVEAHAGPVTPPVLAAEPLKSRATFFTTARTNAARSNIAEFTWAQSIATSAKTIADRFVGESDEWLWSRITTQGVPRSYHVNKALGSPVSGRDVFTVGGVYGFRVNPYTQPWKVIDPAAQAAGEPHVFPTNDFESFHASALDGQGNFDPALGDPQHLVNVLYPEKGISWGVDDGFGWVDGQGHRWTFVAFHNHWAIWHHSAAIVTHLEQLARTYVYTGNLAYAHAGVILLDRIADVYPAMDLSVYTEADGFTNSAVPAVYGRAVNQIWECFVAQHLLYSYDALYPAIADTDDAAVLDFLRTKSNTYGLAPKETLGDIRLNIENGIVRQMFPSVKAGHIQGNFGMHQSVLALAGVVLDHNPETEEWLEFMFAPGAIIVNDPQPRQVTGGDVTRSLINWVDRDGNHREVSPTYNHAVFNEVKGIADILQGYDLYASADIYQNAKFRKMFQPARTLSLLDQYRLGVGDTAPPAGAPHQIAKPDHFFTAFENYRHDADAQRAYSDVGGDVTKLHGSIFTEQVAGTQEAIRQIGIAAGPLQQPSTHLTGYGLAALRDNTPGRGRVAWLFHGSSGFHGHRQTLAVDLLGHGLDLLPCLGYPTVNDPSWAISAEWERHTISSNTVLVDRLQQPRHLEAGFPEAFFDSPYAQGVEVRAPEAYPGIERYRRGLIMVRVDDDHYYLVDVFRVRGGHDHLYSLHTAGLSASVTGVPMVAQTGGTYAGPTVPKPEPSAAIEPDPSGFRWLTEVQRGAVPATGVQIDWTIPDNFGVLDPDPDLHVAVTLIGADPDAGSAAIADELALADGQPAQNRPGIPHHFRYALLRRQSAGSEVLHSQFISIIEPYVGQPTVVAAERVTAVGISNAVAPDDVAAVRITLADGRSQYVISSITDEAVEVDGLFEFQGAMGVLTLDGGTVVAGVTHSAQLTSGAGTIGLPSSAGSGDVALIGTVTSFTRALMSQNRIRLTMPQPVPAAQADDLAGAYVYVANDGARNAVFRIEFAIPDGSDLVLDLGDSSLIRALVDDDDPAAGYIYDITVGQSARIPLTQWWTV